MRKEKLIITVAGTVALFLCSASSHAANWTSTARQGSGNWDSGVSGTSGIWKTNGAGSLTATDVYAADPSATYELLIPGTRMRTTILVTPPPDGTGDPYTLTPLTFPGTSANPLTVDGDGVYRNGPASTDPIAEIRFKCPAVYFPKVIMNGGTWDQGDTTSSNRTVSVHGEVNVNGVNFPLYNDGGADRGFNIDWLTGSGNIEFRAYTDVTTFKPAAVNSFLLLGTSNTYSGTWNIVLGVVLGAGTNSLGTNSITVGTGGALETLYDINNPGANLILNGQLLLHQSNTFNNVVIARTNVLAPGLYTAAQLNALYPSNFPATWTQHLPSTTTANSGYIYAVNNNILIPVQDPASILRGTGQVPENANFTTAFVGQAPIYYQWKRGTNSSGTFTNINDGGRISGATTTSLAISNVALSDAGYYLCSASNAVNSSVTLAAQLSVVTEGGISNFTLSANEPLGSDWESPGFWSFPTGATYLTLVYPLSTFEVLPGAVLRSPNAALDSAFPSLAASLMIDGDSTFIVPSGPTIGTLLLKASSAGRVTFNKLIMNGGQIDNGQDNSYVILAGEIDVLTNTPFFNDAANGTKDRGYQLDAWLTGSGTIECRGFNSDPMVTYRQTLNVTGTSNTFSGQWHVISGTLLGSATNSLGTNNIIVDEDVSGGNFGHGVLETLYDLYNPNAILTITNGGMMYLHQNDSFMAVNIGGVYLTNGTYAFDQLNTLYPANLPLSWAQQNGSTFSSASGSITVLGIPLTIQSSPSNVILSWPLGGTLLEATNLMGPYMTNNATSPYTNTPTDPVKFYRVQYQ